MKKSELVQQLAARANLSRAQAQQVIDALFSPAGIIARALKDGEKVQVSGFGSFETRKREARKTRNPRTGREIAIAASTSVAFRLGKGLREATARRSPPMRTVKPAYRTGLRSQSEVLRAVTRAMERG